MSKAIVAEGSGHGLSRNSLIIIGLVALFLLTIFYFVSTAPSIPLVLKAAEDLGALDQVERDLSEETFDWTSYRHDNGCSGGPLDHILCGHGKDSGKGKSEFDKRTPNEIYHLIEEAVLKGGLKNARATRDNGALELIVDLGRRIGVSRGVPTQRIRIFFERVAQGVKPPLRTAHPYTP